jgi:hypothetical protein
MELLKRVNLVDELYHQHVGKEHTHFHTHAMEPPAVSPEEKVQEDAPPQA